VQLGAGSAYPNENNKCKRKGTTMRDLRSMTGAIAALSRKFCGSESTVTNLSGSDRNYDLCAWRRGSVQVGHTFVGVNVMFWWSN